MDFEMTEGWKNLFEHHYLYMEKWSSDVNQKMLLKLDALKAFVAGMPYAKFLAFGTPNPKI